MVMVIVWERGLLKMILQDGRMMEFPENVKRDLAGWVDVGIRGKFAFAEGNLEVSHDDMTFSDSGWFKIAIGCFSSRFAAMPETELEKEILALLRRMESRRGALTLGSAKKRKSTNVSTTTRVLCKLESSVNYIGGPKK